MSATPPIDLTSLAKRVEPHRLFDFPSLAPPTLSELEALALTPRPIVPGLLFADVRLRIAPGGIGKTTAALYEAMRLALALSIWGYRPVAPIRTCFITREDPRCILLARLRELMRAADLTSDEQAVVLERVRILDLSSVDFRLAAVVGDIVVPHRLAIDELIKHICHDDFRPDWLVFDPAVSLGVGEMRVNDGEQGLVEAARLIRNALDCCVEFIHHSGKANAREQTLDQYTGRGGSAFADGARMVAVLQSVTAEQWIQATGAALAAGETGLVMALPKMSYAPPVERVYIRRSGWRFDHATAAPTSPERIAAATDEQVLQFIITEAEMGRRYSQRDLAYVRDQMGLAKNVIEAACARLRAAGRLRDVGDRGKKTHLEPVLIAAGQVGLFQGKKDNDN